VVAWSYLLRLDVGNPVLEQLLAHQAQEKWACSWMAVFWSSSFPWKQYLRMVWSMMMKHNHERRAGLKRCVT
jgi:hypothetical protein